VEQHLPIRCRAEEVAEQLRRVVGGLPFLAERSWDEVGWGRMRIELLSLWRVELVLEPEPATAADRQVMALSCVDRADAPDGRCWEYGCQRDDWTLGPDSRLVEPLQFLSSEERRALTQKLQRATCWPDPLPADPARAMAPALVLDERIRPRRPPRRTRRRSQP
jgi:hypothetical protein